MFNASLFFFLILCLGGIETGWMVLLKPEVRNMKNGLLSRALINVKYPTRDPLHQTEIGVGDAIAGNYKIGFKSGLLYFYIIYLCISESIFFYIF